MLEMDRPGPDLVQRAMEESPALRDPNSATRQLVRLFAMKIARREDTIRKLRATPPAAWTTRMTRASPPTSP